MSEGQAPGSASEIQIPSAEELARLPQERLTALEQELRAAERRLLQEMAPYQARLGRLRQDGALLQTEQRRRQRQRQIQSRQEVRSQVRQGEAPSLAELVAAPEPPPFGEPAFAELTFLLETGGEVALGYPGSGAAVLQMTDGREVEAVPDLARARQLYRQGWDFGVPARRGVRVHTPGTRLERLLEPEKCFARPRSAEPAPG